MPYECFVILYCFFFSHDWLIHECLCVEPKVRRKIHTKHKRSIWHAHQVIWSFVRKQHLQTHSSVLQSVPRISIKNKITLKCSSVHPTHRDAVDQSAEISKLFAALQYLPHSLEMLGRRNREKAQLRTSIRPNTEISGDFRTSFGAAIFYCFFNVLNEGNKDSISLFCGRGIVREQWHGE